VVDRPLLYVGLRIAFLHPVNLTWLLKIHLVTQSGMLFNGQDTDAEKIKNEWSLYVFTFTQKFKNGEYTIFLNFGMYKVLQKAQN